MDRIVWQMFSLTLKMDRFNIMKETERRKPISKAQQSFQWIAALVVSLLVISETLERFGDRLTPEQAAIRAAESRAFTSLEGNLEAVKDAIIASTAFNAIFEEQQNEVMSTLSENQKNISENLAAINISTATMRIRIENLEEDDQ